MKNQKGFIQIPVLIVILIGALIVSGGTYIGVKKYEQYEKKNIHQEQSTPGISQGTSSEDLKIDSKESDQEITKPKVVETKASEKSSTKSDIVIPKIVEKNFRDPLIALYTHKIFFLKNKISIKEIIKSGNPIVIQNEKDDIAFFENWLDVHKNDGYSAELINLTKEAVNFWKYEIAGRTKILGIEQDRINMWNQAKSRLEKELPDVSSQTFISETEYNFRGGELDELIDENDFEKEYAEQDASIDKWLDASNGTDDKYHAAMVAVATKEKVEVDRELASLNAEIAAIKNTPVYTTPPIITSNQMQPTSIDCETTHDVRSGYPSTTCREFPSMKSMTCDTTYTVGGSPLKHCYFH